jgi:ubiquinone/menaquinone biosynthesis C-methylase UbiE
MNYSVHDISFEELYHSLRKKEGRIYSDEEVACLPMIRSTHPLKREWDIRKESCIRFKKYLTKKRKPLDVLEVGCGNGWFSHQVSTVWGCTVTGTDINATELEQAKRVFPSLNFLSWNPNKENINVRFDLIIFAASFQYFSSPDEVLSACLALLKEKGEIHILDTYFYSVEEVIQAAGRSRTYFTEMGCPHMQQFYFHHTWQSLEGFNYQVLYHPTLLLNRLLYKTPFPWIRITF